MILFVLTVKPRMSFDPLNLVEQQREAGNRP